MLYDLRESRFESQYGIELPDGAIVLKFEERCEEVLIRTGEIIESGGIYIKFLTPVISSQ